MKSVYNNPPPIHPFYLFVLEPFFSLNQKKIYDVFSMPFIYRMRFDLCCFLERQQTIKVVTHNPRLSSLTFHWIVTVFL